MENTIERPGVNRANLVTRHLKLKKLNPATHKSDTIAEVTEKIDTLQGVQSVSFDQRSSVLNLSYDASRLSLDTIQPILQQYGITLSQGWLSRLKESYYRFVDQNVKETSTREPWCCHKLPPQAQSRAPRRPAAARSRHG